MLKRGNPPPFFNEEMIWASVVHLAANDDKYWLNNFEKPCRSRNLAEAAEAAALQRSCYTTPMAIDDVADFQYGTGHGGAAGPYSRRTPGMVTPWQQPYLAIFYKMLQCLHHVDQVRVQLGELV